MIVLRSKLLWIPVGVSMVCHAGLVVFLGLKYLRLPEEPSYEDRPVTVLVRGEDVPVTDHTQDAFSTPAPAHADTSLTDEPSEMEPKPEAAEPKVEPPKQKAVPKPKPRPKRIAKSSPSPNGGVTGHEPVRVGMEGKDDRPRPELRPSLALRIRTGGRRGTTWVRVLVTANGTVGWAQISQSCGYPDLDAAALHHVRTRYRFLPAIINGRPVDMRCQVYVQF